MKEFLVSVAVAIAVVAVYVELLGMLALMMSSG
jgi:hypothetical protein